MIRLFVGLGNPGAEYEATRHNAGFWWVEALARELGARFAPERSYQGLVARVNGKGADGGPVWLLQPMTFMNRSGVSVAALARFFKIEPQHILVIHDELDLQPGQAKLKFGGSAAGHNGLKDIHGMLGTLDFWRLRLGIGHPGVKAEVVNYVLKRPSGSDREAIDKSIEQSMAAAPLLMAGEMDKALARIHAGPQRAHKPVVPAAMPALAPAAAAAATAAPGAAPAAAAKTAACATAGKVVPAAPNTAATTAEAAPAATPKTSAGD